MYETLYCIAKSNECADSVSCGLRLQTSEYLYKEVVDCKQLVVFENNLKIKEVILDLIASEPYYHKERKFELSVCNSILKTKIIKEYNIRFVSEREFGSEDFLFKVDFWKYASKIVFIPDIYYHYCLNTNSLTQSFNPEKYERYKKLYYILYERTKDIDQNKLRVNRFFIGYIRAHIFNLFMSNLSNKEKKVVLKAICDDEIWKKLYSEYSPEYLPIIQRVIYLLLYKKKYVLLFIIMVVRVHIVKFLKA
jgi:hypothetical protein